MKQKTKNTERKTQNAETLPLTRNLTLAGRPATSRTAIPGRQAWNTATLKH